MSVAQTFFFNEIFKDYNDWKYWSEQVEVVDFSKPEDVEFDKFCYKILSRHFSNWNIRYSTIDAFLLELSIVYEDKFNQFKNQKKIIDEAYKLTKEDFEVVSESLTNMANNPNTAPDDPKSPLKYISAQTYGLAKKPKLKAYIEALNNIPTLKIFDFINKPSENGLSFKDLFSVVQNINYFVYGGK